MNKKGVKLNANIVLETKDRKTGKVLQREETHNIVVDTGLELAIRRIFDTGFSIPDVIAIGTGTTSEVAGDTALETEVTRETGTLTFPSNGQCQIENTFIFGSGESYNITEVGLVDSLTVSGSTLFNREVQSAKAVDVDTDLTVTITVTANDA